MRTSHSLVSVLCSFLMISIQTTEPHCLCYSRSLYKMDTSQSDLSDQSSDQLESPGPERKRPRTEGDSDTDERDPLARLLESPTDTRPGPSKPAALPKLDITAATSVKEEEGKTPLLDTPTTPHPDGQAAQERLKAQQAAQERERMQLLVSHFTEDQLDRYAMYRRAALPKTTVKKIMQTITGSSVGQNVVIAMAGIAKVFAGEVIEEALTSMEDLGEAGQPVRPKHLREAVRRMRSKGTFMQKTKKKCPFS